MPAAPLAPLAAVVAAVWVAVVVEVALLAAGFVVVLSVLSVRHFAVFAAGVELRAPNSWVSAVAPLVQPIAASVVAVWVAPNAAPVLVDSLPWVRSDSPKQVLLIFRKFLICFQWLSVRSIWTSDWDMPNHFL